MSSILNTSWNSSSSNCARARLLLQKARWAGLARQDRRAQKAPPVIQSGSRIVQAGAKARGEWCTAQTPGRLFFEGVHSVKELRRDRLRSLLVFTHADRTGSLAIEQMIAMLDIGIRLARRFALRREHGAGRRARHPHLQRALGMHEQP